MIVHFVDKPVFYSDLLLTIVYAMMILMYEHTHNRHTRGESRWGGGEGGGDNQYNLLL